MNTILIILLGCNIYSLLLDRIEVAKLFVQQQNPISNIDWFLSGGIKYPPDKNAVIDPFIIATESEAAIMKRRIEQTIIPHDGSEFNFILDTKSTNTAQNFVRASMYLNSTKNTYSDVYIVTSAFHYDRARTLMNYVDSSNNFKWILGKLEQHDSRRMELIHMKNVYSDYIGSIGSIGSIVDLDGNNLIFSP
jgi:hypothetical protein